MRDSRLEYAVVVPPRLDMELLGLHVTHEGLGGVALDSASTISPRGCGRATAALRRNRVARPLSFAAGTSNVTKRMSEPQPNASWARSRAWIVVCPSLPQLGDVALFAGLQGREKAGP